MREKFVKDDIEPGMLVRYDYGEPFDSWFLYLGNKRLLSLNGWNNLDRHNNNLEEAFEENVRKYDINAVGIIKYNECYSVKDIFNEENIEVIWERPKKKHKENNTKEKVLSLLNEIINVIKKEE